MAIIGQMIGIERISISNTLLTKLSTTDEVKGVWRGLETHTTHLKMIADIAVFSDAFEKYYSKLEKERIDSHMLRGLHARLVKAETLSSFRESGEFLSIEAFENETRQAIGDIEIAAPEDIEPLLEKLLLWIDDAINSKKIHPLIAISVFSAVFLLINPFENKNHTLLHLLITVYMLKAGYGYAPYIPLAPLFKKQGESFYKALRHVQETLETGAPDWQEWLDFMAGLFVRQAYGFVKKISTEKHDLFHLPTLSQKVLKLFEENDRLQMKDIIKLTRGRRSTLKLRIGELVDDGYLKRHGQARSTWYSLI